jgi:hypothetical protein
VFLGVEPIVGRVGVAFSVGSEANSRCYWLMVANCRTSRDPAGRRIPPNSFGGISWLPPRQNMRAIWTQEPEVGSETRTRSRTRHPSFAIVARAKPRVNSNFSRKVRFRFWANGGRPSTQNRSVAHSSLAYDAAAVTAKLKSVPTLLLVSAMLPIVLPFCTVPSEVPPTSPATAVPPLGGGLNVTE